jgi:hypothetical protein
LNELLLTCSWLRYGQAEAEAGRLPQKISARARSAVQERAPAACEESGKRLQMFMIFCEHQKHTQKVKFVFKVVLFPGADRNRQGAGHTGA